MRIKRIIIATAITLGTLAVSAVPLAGAQASSVPAVAMASHVSPDYYLYG